MNNNPQRPENTNTPTPVDLSSSSLQIHVQMIQGVIERMATNSSSCKTWCVTMVAAILVVVADKGNLVLAWISILPIMLFAAMDAYYLAMEKGYRQAYTEFVSKLHSCKLTNADLYAMAPAGDRSKLQVSAIGSFAVWGFYVPLVMLTVIVVFAIAK